MQLQAVNELLIEHISLPSAYLERTVEIDFYLPKNVADPAALELLLINDGQNLAEMDFAAQLQQMLNNHEVRPLLAVGIYAGPERKMEYGVIGQADYLGRGAKAGNHADFVMEELVPYIREHYFLPFLNKAAYAGFSLGGLSALDMTWNYPDFFRQAGVFSGSLWWRSVDQNDPAYHDDQHRIMQQVIRKGELRPGLRFFFQSGNMDETADRNHNGIIDSIDDTLDLIKELEAKGYDRQRDIHYLELADGKHDIPTWGRALPNFLRWGFQRGEVRSER
ncbi:MAG: alpha/beta hydrolase [Chitinophagaceae bacterium]